MKTFILSLAILSPSFSSLALPHSEDACEAHTLPQFAHDEAHFAQDESQVAQNEAQVAQDESQFAHDEEQEAQDEVQDEAQEAREKYLREIAAKNKPGSTAADFLFELRDGSQTTLHEFSTQANSPILLIFYDPDCHHCLEVMQAIKDSSLPAQCRILAIDAEDDRDLWDASAQSLPENWSVGFALDPIQDDDTYVFLNSPTLYLLSPDKTVILKDTSLPEIESSLIIYDNISK